MPEKFALGWHSGHRKYGRVQAVRDPTRLCVPPNPLPRRCSTVEQAKKSWHQASFFYDINSTQVLALSALRKALT